MWSGKGSSNMTISTKRKRSAAQTGQALVLIALMMVGIFAFVALAIDGGRYFEQRRVSQNASDMASLAGLMKYAKNPTTVRNLEVLTEIIRVAQINLIQDTNGNPSDAVNGNVQAWWVNSGGTNLAVIDPTTAAPPGGTAGIKVHTEIPFQTYFAGLIGWRNMTALSDSIARQNLGSTPPFGDMTSDAWVGGKDCDNLTTKIAHNYSNTNSAKFMHGVYVDGSLAVGAVNATDFYGDVEVRVIAGNGSIDGPYSAISPATDNPILKFSGSNDFHGHAYIPPASPLKAASGFPKWSYPNGDKTKPLIDANWFKPGTGGQYLIYRDALGPLADNIFHTITPANLAGVNAAYSAGKRGVYWIDGDLTVADKSPEWENVTLIVTGKFESQDNSHTFHTAGLPGNNISVLAGKNLGGANMCASDKNNWVFKIGAQHNHFDGLIYVPYGQSLFLGNTSGGVGTEQFSKGVITYSFYLGSDGTDQAQNWQFDFDPTLLVQPLLTTELNK